MELVNQHWLLTDRSQKQTNANLKLLFNQTKILYIYIQGDYPIVPVIKELFEKENCTVDAIGIDSENALADLAGVKLERYNTVIFNISFSEISYSGALKLITEFNSNIPVLLMASEKPNIIDSLILKTMKSEAFDYMTPSFSKEELLEKVRKLMELKTL